MCHWVLPPAGLAGLLKGTRGAGQGTSLEAGLRHRPREQVLTARRRKGWNNGRRRKDKGKENRCVYCEWAVASRGLRSTSFSWFSGEKRVGNPEIEAVMLAVPLFPE